MTGRKRARAQDTPEHVRKAVRKHGRKARKAAALERERDLDRIAAAVSVTLTDEDRAELLDELYGE